MDISSRDGVVIVAAFCSVHNFVIFLVHVFPPEGTFNSKEQGHMAYIKGVKTFESAFSLFVDIITIIGVWDMDKHITPTPKHKRDSRRRSMISRLKKPRRALLLFIIWYATTSPANLGPDMVYNYNTSGSIERFVLNSLIRLGIEAAKFYVLYRFGRVYWKLGAEQRPITVDGVTEGATSVGSARAGADASDVKLGSAHFRRRIPYGADPLTSSIVTGIPADASTNPPRSGQHQAQGIPPAFIDWEGATLYDPYCLETTASHHRRASRRTSGEASVAASDVDLDATYESHVIRANRSPQKAQSERGWQPRRSTEAAATGAATPRERPLPERKSGRRLSILAPTDAQRPGPQPVQERAVPSTNDSPLLSGSVRSILRHPDASPRRQRQALEREIGSHDAAAAPDVSPSVGTAGRAEAMDESSALRALHRSREAPSPSVATNIASTSSTPPDKAALGSKGTPPQGDLSATTNETTSTRREKKSKRSSRSLENHPPRGRRPS